MTSELATALTELLLTRAPKQELLRGTTGDGHGNLLVPNLSDYIYVRLRGSTLSIVPAFNLQMPNLADIAVDVLRTTEHSQVFYTILGRTQGFNTPRTAQNVSNVVMHAATHLPSGYDPILFAFANVHVAASYAALATDAYIDVNTGGAVTITLPDASKVVLGKAYLIHDSSGSAATHNITLATTNGQLIEGASTYTINTNKGSALVVSDGKRWSVPIHL